MKLKELSHQRHVPPYSIAIIYAGLNHKEQAFKWFTIAYDAGSFFIALLKVETVLDNLRPDPRSALMDAAALLLRPEKINSESGVN